jgi:hypothetical protein
MQIEIQQEITSVESLLECSPQEKSRRELMQTLQYSGQRSVAELVDMTEAERCKWLFWNVHENLDEIRTMEPTLSARVTGTQFTVADGSRLIGEGCMEKRLDLSCKWTMSLSCAGPHEEITHTIGEGWINLVIAEEAPAYLTLRDGQKAYLDADHSTYPNQIYLEGWITPTIWNEMRAHLSNPNPTCRTDIVLLDNLLFPVKKEFDFVAGPPGALGVITMEFRAFSHPTERRANRRGEPRLRS